MTGTSKFYNSPAKARLLIISELHNFECSLFALGSVHSRRRKAVTVAVTKMETRGRALDNVLSRIYALREARRRGGKAAAAASLVAFFYLAVVFRQGRRPEVVCRRNGHNVRILRALASVIDYPYYPSWLTPNAHVNCMLGFVKRGPKVNKTRELVRAWGKLFAVILYVRSYTCRNVPGR